MSKKPSLKLIETPTSPAERSPERAALAAAIARRDETVAAIAALENALAEAYSKGGAADERVEAAKLAVRAADRNRSAALVAQALGQIPDASAEKAAAVAALAAAEADLKDARELTEALREAVKETKSQMSFRDLTVSDAVKAVFVADPAVGAVLADFESVKVRFKQLHDVICFLEDRKILPDRSSNYRDVNTAAYLEPWLKASHGLWTNPDMPLP